MILYTDLVHRIITDLASRMDDFAHLAPERIAVLAAPRAARETTGGLALCSSLRWNEEPTFAVWTRRGSRRVVRVSRWYVRRAPRLTLDGVEMRYLITLRLPRLMRHDPLPTLIHELYHIGEAFDGRLRPERHGATFDFQVRRIARQWLDEAPEELIRPARMHLDALEAEYGAVAAHGLPKAFALPVIEEVPAPMSYEEGLRRHHPECEWTPEAAVVPAEATPPQAPRCVTERDLTLRHYRDGGSDSLPLSFARYWRQHEKVTP